MAYKLVIFLLSHLTLYSKLTQQNKENRVSKDECYKG